MHSTTPPAHVVVGVGTDFSTMSGWKFWFSDDLSLTGNCSLFDVADYDIVGEYKPPVFEDLTPSRVDSVSALGGASTQSFETESAQSSASNHDSLEIQSKKQVSRVVHACSICGRSFNSEKYLSMHVALHRKSTPPPPHQIHPNVKRTPIFKKTPGLTQRSAACTVGREKWTCEICSKSFAHNSNYKNHIRTHSDERPFVCHVCSIGFKERYHLKKHTLFKHTGELKEACGQCGKRFKDSTAVRAHERIHSQLRPYSCEYCGKAFKTSECLWHHDHRSKTCGRTKHLPVTETADSAPSSTDNSPENQTSSAAPVSLVTPSSTMDFITQQQEALRSTSLHREQPRAASNTAPSSLVDTTLPSLSFISPARICIKQETNLPIAAVKSENLAGPVAPPCYLHQFIAMNSHVNTAGRPHTAGDSKLPLIDHTLAVNHPFQRDSTSGLFVWAPNHVTHKPVAVVVGQHASSHGVAMATKPNNNDAKQKAICSRCGKQFASPLAFERHLAVHNETRPYRCQLCDVGFKLKVHLKKHNLYRHNTDYPCRCGVCGKPFKDSSAVRLHERIHSTARPFQCACGKSFKTRENLWGHRHRRPCASRFGVDSVVSKGNAPCRNIDSATSLPAGSIGSSQTGDVSENTSPYVTCYGDSHEGQQCGTASDVTETKVSCDDVLVECNRRSFGSSASYVTSTRDVYVLDMKPSAEMIDETCRPRHDEVLISKFKLSENSELPIVDCSSLPPFETLVPLLHHRHIPGSGVAGVQHVSSPAMPLTSLNDVITRSTIPPPSSVIKLPCIEQLLDRSTWQPSASTTSSDRDVIECMTSDDTPRCGPVACWDVDLWLDHNMVVTNRI